MSDVGQQTLDQIHTRLTELASQYHIDDGWSVWSSMEVSAIVRNEVVENRHGQDYSAPTVDAPYEADVTEVPVKADRYLDDDCIVVLPDDLEGVPDGLRIQQDPLHTHAEQFVDEYAVEKEYMDERIGGLVIRVLCRVPYVRAYKLYQLEGDLSESEALTVAASPHNDPDDDFNTTALDEVRVDYDIDYDHERDVWTLIDDSETVEMIKFGFEVVQSNEMSGEMMEHEQEQRRRQLVECICEQAHQTQTNGVYAEAEPEAADDMIVVGDTRDRVGREKIGTIEKELEAVAWRDPTNGVPADR